MDPILQVCELTKTFPRQDNAVVARVDFAVYSGEILALVGPSGCGKTTTLRLIAGFERADSGSIQFAGRTLCDQMTFVAPEKRGIGIVFQDYALFPHLNVEDNIQFGLRHLAKDRRKQRLNELLEMVKLTKHRHKMPHQLSAGEQQRVALSRSIAPSPQMVLLDEAFCNLDAGLKGHTLFEVRALLQKNEMSAILVTHDQQEALSIADRIAVMRSGAIEQIGTPEEVYRQPRTPFVAEFLGTTNLLPGIANGNLAQTPLGNIPISGKFEGEVTLSIRPEHLVAITPQNGEETGMVVSRDFKGHDQIFVVSYKNREYQILTDYRCEMKIGERIALQVSEPAVVVNLS